MDEAEFSRFRSAVKRGDLVRIIGVPGSSDAGELSIFPISFMVLSHCLHMLPKDNATKKLDDWVPGSPRNPETYILKDQTARRMTLLAEAERVKAKKEKLDKKRKVIPKVLMLIHSNMLRAGNEQMVSQLQS